jgi:AcrR family transcriptional regulator
MTAALPYDERLERLLTTAAQVFAAKGYHPTTMRDLSRATGMSLAGMYHYVSGKDELLFRVQERCFARVLEGAKRALRRADDPVERLEQFIRHHVTFFADHMDEMKVLSHEADSLGPERKATIDGLKRRYVDLLLGLLGQLPTDGGAARVDTRVAAYALFGMMNWIYTWYDAHGPIPPAALAEQLTEVFLRGVAQATTTAIQGGR